MRSPSFVAARSAAVNSSGLATLVLLSSFAVEVRSQLLSDLNTGPGQPGSSSPAAFALLGSQVYFAAASPLVGRELWVADRNRGAQLAYDFIPGAEGVNPTDIMVWGGGLALVADYGAGRRPYYFDPATRTMRGLLHRRRHGLRQSHGVG